MWPAVLKYWSIIRALIARESLSLGTSDITLAHLRIIMIICLISGKFIDEIMIRVLSRKVVCMRRMSSNMTR